MSTPSKGLSVTAVNYKGVITAFFDDMPGLVVQANSADDVKHKLSSLLASYIKRLDSIKDNINIKTESIA